MCISLEAYGRGDFPSVLAVVGIYCVLIPNNSNKEFFHLYLFVPLITSFSTGTS